VSVTLLSLIVYSRDADFLYALLAVPTICLICLVLLLIAIIRKRSRQSLTILATLVAFLIVSGALIKYDDTVRPILRWLLWSHRFKAELLDESARANGECRHLAWDRWGFAPVGDNTDYLVFDSSDSLASAAKANARQIQRHSLRSASGDSAGKALVLRGVLYRRGMGQLSES
jgi:hypothetical protein